MPSDTPILDAATIVIVRDRPNGMEVFMVMRHHQIDFAAGALVFPGGKVDQADRDGALRARCSNSFGLDKRGLAFRVGAIREAFEESGVLFARERGKSGFVSGDRLRALDPWRERLNAGNATMIEMAQHEDLEFCVDVLSHFAHWITPDLMPKRFDTHFYLARAPEDQLAVHDGGENIDSLWISPQQALDDVQANQRTMVFPTRMNVQKLATYNDVADALDNCGAVVTVEPFLELDDDGKTYLKFKQMLAMAIPKEPVGRIKV